MTAVMWQAGITAHCWTCGTIFRPTVHAVLSSGPRVNCDQCRDQHRYRTPTHASEEQP